MKPFLLTYENPREHGDTFSWFDTEEEMNEFVVDLDVKVIESICIKDAAILR
jgi:hypothetical protein